MIAPNVKTTKTVNSTVFSHDTSASCIIKYSTFKNCRDITPIGKLAANFYELADMFKKPIQRDSKDGLAICPALFNGTRSNENATAAYFIAFDLDNLPESVAALDVLRCIGDFQAFVYSTHSHLLSGKGARYRVVIALSAPIPANLYADVAREFSKRFNAYPNAIDTNCFNVSRLFYMPSCSADRVDLFEYESKEGEVLDWQALLASIPIIPFSASNPFIDIPSNTGLTTSNNQNEIARIKGALEFIQADEYDVWLKVGMSLHSLGDIGFTLWNEWSAQSEKYEDEDTLHKKWASFKAVEKIGLGTIFHLAKLQGYVIAPAKTDSVTPAGFANFDMPRAFTELAVAEAIQKTFGGQFHYIFEANKWFVVSSTSHLWAEDTTGQIQRWCYGLFEYAKERAFCIIRAGDSDGYKILNEIKKAEKYTFISGVINLLKSLDGVTVSANTFDANKYIAGLRGGVCVDLTGHEVRDILNDDYLTKSLGAKYNESATCPLWEKSVFEWCCGDKDLAKFLQVFSGYCLSGETSFQGFLFLYGHGRNGKSVYVQILETLFGSYSKNMNPDSLMLKHGDNGMNNDIARLAGDRFVKSVELPEERLLNENLVKQMVGGDTLTARYMYGEFFDFVPQLKLIIVGNHKPVIRGTDDGVWRRVNLVPFNAVITDENVDLNLTAKLEAEIDGIFNWALTGWRIFKAEGLKIPDVVKAESKLYREDSDVVGRFLAECAVFDNKYEVSAKQLFGAYKIWCDEAGFKAGTDSSFGRRLSHRVNSRRSNAGKIYEGVKLR